MPRLIHLATAILIGLPTACVTAAGAPFLFWGETDPKSIVIARYAHAFCELEASLTTGRYSRESQAIIARARATRDGGGLRLDLRRVDDQWDMLCLSSIVSDEPTFRRPEATVLAGIQRARSICWGWSERFITVLALHSDGYVLPLKFPVEQAWGPPKVSTDYAMTPIPSRMRQCSRREDAIATCRSVTTYQGPECILTFGD